jgi:hypothetical protein
MYYPDLTSKELQEKFDVAMDCGDFFEAAFIDDELRRREQFKDTRQVTSTASKLQPQR